MTIAMRVLHIRQGYVAGVSRTGAGRFGSGAEVVTNSTAGELGVPTRYFLGAYDVSGNFHAAIQVKALLLYKGDDYTSAGKYAIVNAFAEAHLGATL